MGADTFRRCFEAGDIDGVIEDLAPGFTFHHAARPEPTTDPGPMTRIFAAARSSMGDQFRFTEHGRGDGIHALRWIAVIDGNEAEGVDVIREDDEGRMLELRITMRPLPVMLAWNQLMGAALGGDPHQAETAGD